MNNVIEIAVAPLKEDAVERAVEFAKKTVEEYRTELEANGMNMTAIAPRPTSYMSRTQYRSMQAKREFMYNFIERDADAIKKFEDAFRVEHGYHPRYKETPELVMFTEERTEKFLKHAAENAAAQYEAFVMKLTNKVGEAVAAELEGNHVWSHSVLRVTKEDGSVEKWKTKMILNVSKLGKLFNQWPTRKVK